MADKDRSFGEKAMIATVDLTAAIFADIVTDARRRVIEEKWFGAAQDGPVGASSKLAQFGQPPAGEDVDPFDPWGWNKEPDNSTVDISQADKGEGVSKEPRADIDHPGIDH